MLKELNRIRNSDFSVGKRKPQAWAWSQRGRHLRWEAAPATNGDLGGVIVRSREPTGHGLWRQRFRARKEQYYRIEAVVSCNCRAEDDDAGLVLSLHPFDRDGRRLEAVHLAPLRKAQQFTLRSFYEFAPNTRQVELRIGLVRAAGDAVVHDVRVIPVMEPEHKSYPSALPPPPFAAPPPVHARRVCIVTTNADRPLVDILRKRYGERSVRILRPTQFDPAKHDEEAVLLLDDSPPQRCRNMTALSRLAERRVVLVSLDCMAAISGGKLSTRRIEQIDDPLHARIMDSDFVTSAFALRDMVPFAGRDDTSTRQYQRQFRSNSAFRDFCESHGLELMLDAVTDADSTSEKPIALLQRTERGAIVIMDVEPAEAVNSSLDEPTAAVHLVLAALGATQHSLGQFTVPARDGIELRNQLSDLLERFPELSVAEADLPRELTGPVIISLGKDLESYGLPLPIRPMILLRTGLTGMDLEGVYGVIMWFKQLLRPPPFASPYVRTLLQRFRVAWMPMCAPVPGWCDWHPERGNPRWRLEAEFEPGTIAACIDITTSARHAATLTTSRRSGLHDRLAGALPDLTDTVCSRRHFYRAVPIGAWSSDRTIADWRLDDLELAVASDPQSFTDGLHRAASAAGAELLRLETPTTHTDPFANSIWRTDWIANTLEQIVGLMIGLVCVNRNAQPLAISWPDSIKKLRSNAVMRRINKPDNDMPVPADKGGRLTIPPGHAVIAVR